MRLKRRVVLAGGMWLLGTGALVIARLCTPSNDPFGDWHRIAVTSGSAVLLLAFAVAFLPYRDRLLPVSDTASGVVLAALGAGLMAFAPRFLLSKGTGFLWGTFSLTGLLVAGFGVARAVTGFRRRSKTLPPGSETQAGEKAARPGPSR